MDCVWAQWCSYSGIVIHDGKQHLNTSFNNVQAFHCLSDTQTDRRWWSRWLIDKHYTLSHSCPHEIVLCVRWLSDPPMPFSLVMRLIACVMPLHLENFAMNPPLPRRGLNLRHDVFLTFDLLDVCFSFVPARGADRRTSLTGDSCTPDLI